MRVAVVHDYLTQRGGAERVALSLLKTFPGSKIITSLHDQAATYPEFQDYEVVTLWPQRFSALRADPRRALPVLAKAFGSYTVTGVDAVVCSSSGWAHGISTDAPKLVYCHNTARWLYQPDEYLRTSSPRLLRTWVSATKPLVRWDQQAAKSAAAYFANSTAVAARVRSTYGIEAEVVPPAAELAPGGAGAQQPVSGILPGYFLTVGRRRGYKNTEIVGEAFRHLPKSRLVVVGGLPARAAGPYLRGGEPFGRRTALALRQCVCGHCNLLRGFWPDTPRGILFRQARHRIAVRGFPRYYYRGCHGRAH